jgi:hypothetical protein
MSPFNAPFKPNHNDYKAWILVNGSRNIAYGFRFGACAHACLCNPKSQIQYLKWRELQWAL